MKTDKRRHAHLYIAAISGGFAYSGEFRYPGEVEAYGEVFEGARSLPRDANGNYRDTMTAIIAALEHCATQDVAGTSHTYIHTNLQGLEKAWRSGADFWTATGKFNRQDGMPLANADLWERIVGFHRQTPLTIMFAERADRRVCLRLRIVKAAASDVAIANKEAA